MLTRNNSFTLSQHPEPTERFLIRGYNVLGPSGILQPGMLGPYTRVVETSTDRMCFYDLACSRLKDISPDTVENTWLAH